MPWSRWDATRAGVWLPVVGLGATASVGAQTMSYRLHYAKAGEAFIHVSLVPSTPLPAPRVLVVPRAIPRRAFRTEELPVLVESATSVDTRDV